MTLILTGPREMALARVKTFTPRELIVREPGDTNRKAAEVNEAAYHRWQERDRTHAVWIDPHPDWDPKHLKPHPGRHVVFTTTEKVKNGKVTKTGGVPAKWLKWAAAHSVTVTETPRPDRSKRILALTSGKVGLKFTTEAAELLVDLVPGGYDELYWPVQMLKHMQVPQPVRPEHASLVCFPTDAPVNAAELMKALGTRKGLTLARQVEKSLAYGGLKYLEAVYARQTSEEQRQMGCTKQAIRLQYLEALFLGIESRRWTPWMALQILAHLTLTENLLENPSSSTSTTTPSRAWTRPASFLLYGIPSLPPRMSAGS